MGEEGERAEGDAISFCTLERRSGEMRDAVGGDAGGDEGVGVAGCSCWGFSMSGFMSEVRTR